MTPQSKKIPESVLVIIHTLELEVLLLERADRPGSWQSVTGSRDSLDEPLRDTAIREVAEETGIHVGSGLVSDGALIDWNQHIVYDIYPAWLHWYEPGVTRNTEHVFGLLVDRSVPVRLAPSEHLRHRWLGWQEAADACFSSTNANAIRQLSRHS